MGLTGYEETSVVEVGAVLDASPATAEEVYLRTIGHSERAIAAVAAKRAGRGAAPNWCVVTLDTPSPLTIAASSHPFAANEITITSQSGTDFSVAEVDGEGAVLSASGGLFQAGLYMGCPSGHTLDGASDHLRYLWFALTLGESASAPDLNGLGLDALLPIFPSGTDNAAGAASGNASLPGFVAPGGPAVLNPFIELIGGIGTDSIPLDALFGFGSLAIWQIT